MRLVMQIGVVGNNALRPVLSRLIGGGQRDKAVEFTRKVVSMATLCAALMYLALLIVGPAFIGVWGGGQVFVTTSQCALIGFHALLNVVWYVPAALRMAGNDHSGLAAKYSIACFVAIIGWIALAGKIDPLLGAALTLVIPELVAVAVTRIGDLRK